MGRFHAQTDDVEEFFPNSNVDWGGRETVACSIHMLDYLMTEGMSAWDYSATFSLLDSSGCLVPFATDKQVNAEVFALELDGSSDELYTVWERLHQQYFPAKECQDVVDFVEKNGDLCFATVMAEVAPSFRGQGLLTPVLRMFAEVYRDALDTAVDARVPPNAKRRFLLSGMENALGAIGVFLFPMGEAMVEQAEPSAPQQMTNQASKAQREKLTHYFQGLAKDLEQDVIVFDW